jgi:hypothetical protein
VGSAYCALGSIYWDDEMPDTAELVTLPEGDRNRILRLFSIRFKVWDGKRLSDDEQSSSGEMRKREFQSEQPKTLIHMAAESAWANVRIWERVYFKTRQSSYRASRSWT